MTTAHIRVLRVIGLLDPEYGGPSESSVSACIATQRSGVMNTFVFGVAAGSTGATLATEQRLRSEAVVVRPFTVIRLANYHAKRWGLSMSLCYWIVRHIRRFDIVHLHQTWGLPQVIGLAAATLARRPCVVSPHESLTGYDVEREKSVVKRWLKRAYLRYGALIILASDLEAADSMGDRSRAKSRVLAHPLADYPRAATSDGRPPSTLRAPSSPPGRFTVGYLGRLHPKKNVDLLISAIAGLPDDVALRVAGDGLENYKAGLLRGANAAGVADRIEWLGFVGRDDRSVFFDGVDLLALVSEYECFGVAAAEAMAHGVPVLVSDRTGIAPLVARYRCGFVVPPDVSSITEVLRTVRDNDQLLAGSGARGQDAVRDELSMDAYGARVRRCYEDLVATRQ